MKISMRKLVIFGFLSLFLGSNSFFLAMEQPGNQQETEQTIVSNDWVRAFDFKNLKKDPTKTSWQDYKRIHQALNLLLLYEQSLCALEQLPPFLKLMQESQQHRLYENDRQKVISAFSPATINLKFFRVTTDFNALLLHSAEGKAACMQVRQLLPTFGEPPTERDLDQINTFIPWLANTNSEIRNIAGTVINKLCQDYCGNIIVYQLPNIFTRGYVSFFGTRNKTLEKLNEVAKGKGLLNIMQQDPKAMHRLINNLTQSLKERAHLPEDKINWNTQQLFAFLQSDFLASFDPEILNKAQNIPYITELCKLSFVLCNFVHQSIISNDLFWIAQDSSIIQDVQTIISICAPYREMVINQYQTLFAILEHALKTAGDNRKKEFLNKNTNIYGSLLADKLPECMTSLKKPIRTFAMVPTLEIEKEEQPAILQKIVIKKKKQNNTKKTHKKNNNSLRAEQQIETKAEGIDEYVDTASETAIDAPEVKDIDELTQQEAISNNNSLVPQQSVPVIPGIPLHANYAPRVLQYFVPGCALDVYHCFTRLVDNYLWKYGTTECRTNNTYNTSDTVYKLAGEIKYSNGQREYVIWHATKNNNNVCYHRGYEVRPADFFDKFVSDKFWKLNECSQDCPSVVQNSNQNCIETDGKVLKESDWAVQIFDNRLKATITLYKPYSKKK